MTTMTGVFVPLRAYTGTLRYFAIQRALPQGFFPAARLSIFVQAVSLGALIGVVFGILVAVH